MAASLRAVRQRIRAVQSIGKITRAQELIASSRIIRAQQRMRDAGPYARELTRAVEAVVSRTSTLDHPLTAEPESVTRAAVLVLTSDSGFAGAFNTNVLREEARLLRTLSDRNVEAVPFVAGRKGIGWHRARDIEMAHQYSGFSVRPTVGDATAITNDLLEAFDNKAEGGGVDEIYIVRTEFVSMLTQRPLVARLLPLEIEESSGEPEGGPLPMYEFEPSPSDRAGPAAAAVRRGPDLLRDAGVGRVRAGLAPPGHEGGHRQRQRPDGAADPGGQQRPAGRDHPGNQ